MSKPPVHPPKLAERFLQWLCAEEVLETLQGDLYEMYERRFEASAKWKADLHFYRDVLDVCRPFAWRKPPHWLAFSCKNGWWTLLIE